MKKVATKKIVPKTKKVKVNPPIEYKIEPIIGPKIKPIPVTASMYPTKASFFSG